MAPAIQIDHLSKTYNKELIPALKEIDLDIPEKSIFGLLGPNGAGKTTLISILCGLIKPTFGSFSILGIPSNKSKNIKKIIGVVPQEYSLYPTLSPYENLTYLGSLYSIPKRILKDSIDQGLEQMGLQVYKHRPIKIFSGGMKRRVNLLAGLLHKPKVLFLDEPTVGVDVQSRTQIIKYLHELNAAGMTIIYTSHLMVEAESFCTDIAIIDQGQIILKGKPDSLVLDNPYCNNLEELFISLTTNNLQNV